MGRRGRNRQLEVEARYWELLASGVGTVAACRAVGITRKTGYRWRAETGGLAPARLAEHGRSNRYLSLLERQRIAALRARGLGIREIARTLERSASTISRESRRNTAAHDRGGYEPVVAHSRARERSARPGRSRLSVDSELRREVQDKLLVEWSPEQIAAHLRLALPGRTSWLLCHETIYQALYKGARGGLSRTLSKRLRTGRPLRKHRRRPDQRRSRYIDNHQGIAARPAVVQDRRRLGDWEGDLVVGPMSRSAVATLVDRRSGFLHLVHLPDGHRAEQLLTALNLRMGPLPQQLRRTLTWDQGSEMACHSRVALLFEQGVFFADPGSPWMRGTNENTNGLVRQYLPKSMNLSSFSADDLQVIEDKLNHRPRKRLGWGTPAQTMALGAD